MLRAPPWGALGSGRKETNWSALNTLCGEHHASQTLRRDAGGQVDRARGQERAIRWGGNEARAEAGMKGGAEGRGVRRGLEVAQVRYEGLDDAIDLEIEKVRRTTCRTDFCDGLLHRVIVCGKLADPAAMTREPFVFNNLELVRITYHTVELRDGTSTPWRFQ